MPPSITSAPVSDEMNRVPEDLHRRGGPMKIMIVILRVIRWQTLHGPGYLQQRFAQRPSAGANLFFQQLVQFRSTWASSSRFNFVSSLMISCVLICSLLSNRLQLAARVLRINSLPLAVNSSPRTEGKTPAFSTDEVQKVLNSIDTSHVVELTNCSARQ